MSESLPFHSSSSKSLAPIPRASLHTCEPYGTSCQQMAESQVLEIPPSVSSTDSLSVEAAIKESRDVGLTQQETNTFSNRGRHITDGANSSWSGSAPGQGFFESDGFHLYHQRLSDGAMMASLYPEPAVPIKPSCFLSEGFISGSSSLSPSKQVAFRKHPHNDQCSRSKYYVPTQSQQENSMQSPFPKPIYSYSVLIFMALKNSKTGSLPVSEIYSFMTEHFPYFKTAPEGWKNSVRHNLSLNKCFVKAENKNGNSSRKGCLWSLNPAKVEKMQDELHKWRRKDPMTVRRSMARPECLDRLLGERPVKFKSLPPCSNTALLSRVAPLHNSTSSSCSPGQHQPPHLSAPHIQPLQPCYLPATASHTNNSFPLYSQTATGGLNSPMAGKMVPVHGLGPRSMQEFLLEADASYDIDLLNPSLTDLQLQGNLWEELREDSLVTD